MKKILKINSFLYFLFILITIVFITNWYDEINKDKLYNSNYGYKYSKNFTISSKVKIDSDTLKEIDNLSKQYNIILEKKVTDINNNNTIHYLNMDNYSNLINLFKLKNQDNIKGISTIKDKSNNYIIKKDFLNNDFHIFKLFNDYYNEQTNYTGEYKALYNSNNDLDKFISELSIILNTDYDNIFSNGFSITKTNQTTINKIYLIVTAIMIISLFIVDLYSIFKNSNNIGIYKLLGFSKYKIIKYQILEDLKYNLIISILMALITIIFIKNISILFILILILSLITIMLIKLIITILSVNIICKKLKIINLIKKQNITEKIIKFNLFFQVITFGIILTLSLFVGIEFKMLLNKKTELNSFKQYSEYAVFSQFYIGNDNDSLIGGSDDIDVAEENLYKYLSELNIVYVDFRNYFPKTKDEENYYNTLTENGNKKYNYGTIDFNYLKDLKLINYYTNEVIDVDSKTTNVIFLIPSSMVDELSKFKRFYYEYYDKNDNDQFIVYKDTLIPTLSPYIVEDNHYSINSPILKIITPNNIKIREVNVFGSGYDTSLKIKINNYKTKQDFYEEILPKLVELGLNDNLNIDTIFTYNELFSNEINTIMSNLTLLITVLLLLIFIYFYILFQTYGIYIKDKFREIAVKKLNGFSNYKIFKDYIINNISIINIVLIIVFYIFRNSYNVHELLMIQIFVNAINLLIIVLIIKIKFKDFIVKVIKGGEI